MKKSLKILLILIIIIQLLCACSSNKNNNITYSVAIGNVCFSAENANLCFALSKNRSIVLEKDDVMTDLYDYSYSDDFYGMQNPFVYSGNLYYISSSRKNTMCIACIDINDLKNADILTPEKDNIFAFTVFGNNVYYYAYNSDCENTIYSFNLKTKKETEILSTDDYIYNFFVSDEYIIYGNTKYDLNKKQSYTLSNELSNMTIAGLGIVNDIYYCSSKNSDMSKNEIYSVNLKDNTVICVCEIPVGFNEPRLYDNKILFVNSNEADNRYLMLGYYDLNTNEEKIAFDKTSDTYYYSKLYDYIDNYDSFYYDGNFYMWYPETIVKVNNKNEDKIFGLSSYNTDDGYISHKNSWLTYDEYLNEMNI